jgi:hypothetical protein
MTTEQEDRKQILADPNARIGNRRNSWDEIFRFSVMDMIIIIMLLVIISKLYQFG